MFNFDNSDRLVQVDCSVTENKMSRHMSQRKSLNFYPTALFAEGVLAIPHCSTFACCRLRRLGFAHHKQKSAILPTRIIMLCYIGVTENPVKNRQ
jgi:hypothetical protein